MDLVKLKQRFLTRGYNNALVILLGVPAASFITFSYVTGLSDELGGLIGMGIIGLFY